MVVIIIKMIHTLYTIKHAIQKVICFTHGMIVLSPYKYFRENIEHLSLHMILSYYLLRYKIKFYNIYMYDN